MFQIKAHIQKKKRLLFDIIFEIDSNIYEVF